MKVSHGPYWNRRAQERKPTLARRFEELRRNVI